MINIHFIVNPISGKGKHVLTLDYLLPFFASDRYEISVHESTYKRHAVELTQNAIAQNADIVVACGGDGTIHEVATELIGKNVILGIIPVGSGNGLASNLRIPKQIEAAIAKIKNHKVCSIDVGKVNEEYFFSNIGFGIDATIIDNYEKSGKRKLSSYIRAALNSAQQYKAQRMLVKYNGQSKHVNPLLLFISNSNEMGYNMSLTPQASLTDGLLDYLMVPKINIFKQLLFGLYVVCKQTKRFRKVDCQQLSSLEVEFLEREVNGVQIDGEYYEFAESCFKIKIVAAALKVLQ